MGSVEELVSYSPSDLIVFPVCLGHQSLVRLTITNISDSDVVYKIKTTAPRRYCVRPNSEILPYGTVIDVEFILQAFLDVPPDAADCKDKFQLLVAALPRARNPTDSPPPVASDVWHTLSQESISQAKFKVQFRIVPDEDKRPENFHLLDSTVISGQHVARKPVAHPTNHQGPVESTKLPSDATARPLDHDAPVSVAAQRDDAISSATSRTGFDIIDRLVGLSTSEQRLPNSPRRRISHDDLSHDRSSRPRSLSPRSACLLAQAPTVEDRKAALSSHIEKRAEAAALHSETPSIDLGPESVESRVKHTDDSSRLDADTHSERRRAAVENRDTAAFGIKPADAPLTYFRSTASDPAGESVEPSAEEIAASRARLLSSRSAPQVDAVVLSEEAAQRAAVERAGELMRISKQQDAEIATVREQLAEARHKLSDAKMAVLPAYDVKYEVDGTARIPLSQIVVMAAISFVVLKLLV